MRIKNIEVDKKWNRGVLRLVFKIRAFHWLFIFKRFRPMKGGIFQSPFVSLADAFARNASSNEKAAF